MYESIRKSNAGKVHKRHMKAAVRKNARQSIGRTGVRHARKVDKRERQWQKHNATHPMDQWVKYNRVR
jgi:hypothetical protein